MSSKSNTSTFWQIVFAALAIWAIKSLLEDDGGRVVSSRGADVLEDEKKMQRVDGMINEAVTSEKGSSAPIAVSFENM